MYVMPSYQKKVVAAYLNSATGKAAKIGYNKYGRGYPDLSALGASYLIVVGGKWYVVAGTSASSPVVAAMVSLVNSARLAANMVSIMHRDSGPNCSVSLCIKGISSDLF